MTSRGWALALTWLPPVGLVAAALSLAGPPSSPPEPVAASGPWGLAILGTATLSLAGIALGLQQSAHVAGTARWRHAWPFVAVAPVPPLLLAIWWLFFRG